MKRWLLPIALLATGATPAPRMAHIEPIALKSGVNRVPGFLPGGGAATIVEAWRGNGNAHGYHVWMVLTGPSENNPVGVAPIEGEGRGDEVIRDEPFDGERVIGTVRFARGTVDGKPASLLLTARLDFTPRRPLADHEIAMIEVYRLEENAAGIGAPVLFRRIATMHSNKRYCNADLALRDMLAVALPADFAAANQDDGCIAE